MTHMTGDVRDLIINEDLGWLQQMKVHQVDGKLMLGEEESDLPFNVSHIIEEAEFVKKWLMPFALGNSLGVNYFPVKAWYDFTFNGTRAVLVVKRDEETGKMLPSLLVPPLISHSLTDEDRELLRKASAVIYVNSKDVMKANNMNANLEVAEVLRDPEVGLKAKPLTMTELINPAFFEKYGIVPEVEQKVYYIRDIIHKGEEVAEEDLTKARPILYRDHKGLPVTREEYLFLSQLSKGEFNIEGKVENAPTSVDETGAVPKTPDNPLEC